MKVSEFKTKMSEIRAISDNPQLVAILTELEHDYESVHAEREQAIADKEKAVAEKEQYREINNQLWQATHVAENTDVGNEENTDQEPPQKLSYEDLELGDDI